MADETPKAPVPEVAPVQDEAPPGAPPNQRVRKPPEGSVVPEDRSKELGSPGEHKHGDLKVTTF